MVSLQQYFCRQSSETVLLSQQIKKPAGISQYMGME